MHLCMLRLAKYVCDFLREQIWLLLLLVHQLHVWEKSFNWVIEKLEREICLQPLHYTLNIPDHYTWSKETNIGVLRLLFSETKWLQLNLGSKENTTIRAKRMKRQIHGEQICWLGGVKPANMKAANHNTESINDVETVWSRKMIIFPLLDAN